MLPDWERVGQEYHRKYQDTWKKSRRKGHENVNNRIGEVMAYIGIGEV